MDAQPNTLFVILARGGSKRLPEKNLCEVGGVPLVGRTVRTAIGTASLLRQPANVIVSTDDEKIARVARRWGARTPFMRPDPLADDEASSRDALLHAVANLSDNRRQFGELVLLQPTSPLALPRDIVRAVRCARKHACDSVVTVRKATSNDTPNICYGLDGNRVVETGSVRVALNGAAYVCSPRWLRQNDGLCKPGTSRAVVMPQERSVDVDTQTDLERAHQLWQQNLPWRSECCTIVADLETGFGGSFETMKAIIDAASAAGANAIKFQTVPDFARAAENLSDLFDHCRKLNLRCLACATTDEDVDLLDELDAPAFAIAGKMLDDNSVLTRITATGRPVVLSAGSVSQQKLVAAAKTLREAGCTDLLCMRKTDGPTGGINMIEKPFALNASQHAASKTEPLDPETFRAFVASIRKVESIMAEPASAVSEDPNSGENQ